MNNYKSIEAVKVTVNENYSIIAETNYDSCDLNEFHYDLWLEDTQSGMRILVKEDVTSGYACNEVAKFIEILIDREYFDTDIKTIENLMWYVNKLKITLDMAK